MSLGGFDASSLDPRRYNPRTDINAPWLHIDLMPLLAVFSLSGIGLAMIYSATRGRDPENFVTVFLERQGMWIMVGIGLMVIAAMLDYRIWGPLTPLVYGGAISLLIAVRLFGSVRGGARSWFGVGEFGFQPSELVKLALILTMAWWLSRFDRPLDAQETAIGMVLGAVPSGLVILQPDVGTAMVYIVIMAVMLLVGGVPLRYLAIVGALSVTALTVLVRSQLLAEYQLERLNGFFDFGNAELADTYNVDQAKIAIGNGGLTGLGYGQGTQTNSGLVPAQETDFIFTVVGEELGFVGGIAVLALFTLLLWRVYRAAVNAGDRYGSLICTGVLAMFAFQIFQSIGMTMGMVPVTGIPLPFLSYGGSSTMTSYLAIGLVMSVWMRRYMAGIERTALSRGGRSGSGRNLAAIS